MDLKQLKAMGLVNDRPMMKVDLELEYFPLKPESDWQTPKVEEREAESTRATVTVYLRRHTAADMVMISAVEDNELRAWMTIQRCTFTEDGERLFPTIEDAIGLDLQMFGKLLTRINEINNGTKKNSIRKMSSGVSSLSLLEDEALPNGKTDSAQMSTPSGSSTEQSSVL